MHMNSRNLYTKWEEIVAVKPVILIHKLDKFSFVSFLFLLITKRPLALNYFLFSPILRHLRYHSLFYQVERANKMNADRICIQQ